MKRTVAAAWMLAGIVPLACAGRQSEPNVASSAHETSYALDYPSSLQAIVNDYVNSEGEVRRLTTGFSRYPDQLKDPPWPLVTTIVDQADAAGRSAAYVDAHRELEQSERFFNEERDDIARRVTGSLQYVIKKSEKNDKGQCDVDLAPSVGPSLKDAVDKEMEKRLRAHDEAHFTIERYREALGRSNASALEKQTDEISAASYLAFVHAATLRGRAEGLVDEATRVKDTLSKSEEEEKAFQGQAGRTAAEKRSSNERIAKLEAAKVRIDGTLPQLAALVNEIDRRNHAQRKEYDDAFDGLKKAIASKSASR
jgi:chromosome segregation ATPase